MTLESEYNDAIHAVNDCVVNDDRTTWWPKIKRIEGNRKIHDINGEECGSSGGNGTSYEDAMHNALLRLVIDKSLPCALFVYPVKDGIQLMDIIVGFLDEEHEFRLACNNKHIYPMIGNSTEVPNIPTNTKWIVGAALNTNYRRAVSFYNQIKK